MAIKAKMCPRPRRKMKRDIDVKIVTAPILDPETGREREIVNAFTVRVRQSESAAGRR